MRGHTQRPQGAKNRPALFEGEPYRAVHDEEPDREGQKPEGRQVEMETVGQPTNTAIIRSAPFERWRDL